MTGARGGQGGDGARRYAPERADARLVHVLDPVTLVYHRRSGATHLLTEPAPQILGALDVLGPADAAGVAAYLGERFDLSGDGDNPAEALIEARLDELAALGLIRVEGV